MKQRKKGLRVVCQVAAVLTALSMTGSPVLSYALIDETNAVYIDASSIENATLIIGTHLIYLGSMNDQIYEKAMKSAEEANQYNRYYKSELAGGIWYDITDAGALADITTTGIVVEDKVIEGLFMTHHTKSDGITYDLKNGGSVSVFDMDDPYDLEELPELEPIKLQYDVLVQTEEPSDTMERDMDYIEEIYKFDRETDKTRELDKQIEALQKYYEVLVRDKADSSMSDMVMSVMEKLDADRRAEVLSSLNDYQLQKMSQVAGREFTYLAGEITGVYTIAEEREKNADEDGEEAEEKTKQEEYEKISKAKAELADLKKDLEAAVKATESGQKEIRDEYQILIDAETDEEAKAQLIKERDAKINEIIEEASKDILEKINEQEDVVKSIEDGVDEKISEAVEAAREAALNAERDVVEDFVANTDLITAIGEAMANVQESYINYSSKMLAEGTTVLSRAEYRFSNDLIAGAEGSNYAACDMAVNKLIYLDRINNSVIREEDDERSFIALELLGEAKNSYAASVGAGAGEAYQTLSTMASAATRANVLKEQLSGTDIARNELQFIMQAYMDRMAPQDAMEYITGCIDGIADYRSKVKTDAYETYANTSIDSHLEWMTKTVKNLQGQMGGSELDGLNQKKQDLQTQRMTALDRNRLDEAKKIEKQIEAVDKEIEEVENYLNAVLNSENASASEKALASAKLGGTNVAAAIQEFKNNAIEEIKNGNLDGVGGLLEGIGALAGEQPGGAVDALKDVYQELVNQELMGADSDKLRDLMSQTEEITAEQIGHLNAQYSRNELAMLIQEFVDENLGGSNADGKYLSEGSQSGSDSEGSSVSGNETPENGQPGSDNEGSSETGNEISEDDQTGSVSEGSSETENGTSGDGQTGSGENGNTDLEDNQAGSDNAGSGDDNLENTESGSGSSQEAELESDSAESSEAGNDTGDSKDSRKDQQLKEVMNGLDDKQLAVILAGLSRYTQQKDFIDGEKAIKQFGNIALNQGNGYIFEQLRNQPLEYLPTDQLSKIIGFRYIFNDSQKEATIQRGSQYYKFSAFSTMFQKGMESKEMNTAAGFQGVIYIPEDAAQEYFTLTAEYLNDTSYGIILTEEMQELAAMFAEYLLEARGE